MFNSPAVQAVFVEYETRAAADLARMKALGPVGYAIRDEFLLPVGAIVLADNMLSPEVEREAADKYRAEVAGVAGLSSVLLPIGSGIELSVKQ